MPVFSANANQFLSNCDGGVINAVDFIYIDNIGFMKPHKPV